MGHLLGYARVSTDDQDPALQHDALTAAGCDRIFSDVASGAKAERPQLAKLLDYAREGDTVVVWKLDRLGRSLPHLIETVGAMRDRGIHFRSLQEAMDTSTPGGKLIFHIFGAIAEFERDLIRERTNAGLAAARARGRFGGRKRAMTPVQVDLAHEMHASKKHTLAEIARTFGVSRATLYRELDRRVHQISSEPDGVRR
ncbi:recombinase family protein [Planomonospora sp. ID67723]|nr:recombinase family protein [Planomonospora sp. ID67723]